MPKFIIFVHASADSEAGKRPTTQELTEMTAFNEELSNAGALLAGEGLLASSKGARVAFSESGDPAVTPGPFALGNLVAGLWLLKLDSFEEAVAWARKIPFRSGSVEVRKVAGPEDFGGEYTEEVRAKEDELRKRLARE